jgi:hypothetical protein
MHGEEECIQCFGERQKEKRPQERPRHRWEENIKTDLTEIGWSGMDRIHLAQDRDQWQDLVNTVKNLWVPQNGKFSSR